MDFQAHPKPKPQRCRLNNTPAAIKPNSEMIKIQRSNDERTFHGKGGGVVERKLFKTFERFAEDLGHSARCGGNGKNSQ